MTEGEARARLARYLQELIGGDANYQPPASWADENPRAEQRDADTWLFWFRDAPAPAGIVISTSYEVPFGGALGKLVPHLGPPRTPERFLGSSPRGRYQLYADGIAVWEGRPDIGFPIPTLPDEVYTGRQCQAIVAFFDLRGFTSWSGNKGRTAAQIQHVVRELEEQFQRAFSKKWCPRLFSKGTGDGFMLISEAGWVGDPAEFESVFQQGHAALFARACAMLTRDARERLPAELAIGCGIALGEMTQIFLLGRLDYIGAAVNEAAKIQQFAWDELCVTDPFRGALAKDGVRSGMCRLGDQGWRLSVQECIEATEAIAVRHG